MTNECVEFHNRQNMKAFGSHFDRKMAGTNVRAWDLAVPQMGRRYDGITEPSTTAATLLARQGLRTRHIGKDAIKPDGVEPGVCITERDGVTGHNSDSKICPAEQIGR